MKNSDCHIVHFGILMETRKNDSQNMDENQKTPEFKCVRRCAGGFFIRTSWYVTFNRTNFKKGPQDILYKTVKTKTPKCSRGPQHLARLKKPWAL